MKKQALTAAGLLAGGLTLSTAGVYHLAFHSPNRVQNDDKNLPPGEQMAAFRDKTLANIEKLQAMPYERVTITSRDGLTLAGRLFMQDPEAPLAIGFHGYRGTPFRDFSGGALFYLSQGMNLLLAEQRAHLSSEGHTITFGVQERYDCLAWTRWAVERFGEDRPFVLCGISMGAATVLLASALPLPQNVRGIIADASYTSPEAIIRKVCREDMHLPDGLAWPLVLAGARTFGRFDPRGTDVCEAVRQSKVPILLFHGEDDRFVPCEMGRQIAAANPEKITFLTFPGAGHGLSMLVDEERYTGAVREFLGRVLEDYRRNGTVSPVSVRESRVPEASKA